VMTPNCELLRSSELGIVQVLLFQASNISMRKSIDAIAGLPSWLPAGSFHLNQRTAISATGLV
jgi:hypothetical protein